MGCIRLKKKLLVKQHLSKRAKLGMSGHTGCIRLKTKNAWWNHNGHNVQIWLMTGHSSFFFFY